jgi:type II restriction/modification system DNA methylase subunit YeeA
VIKATNKGFQFVKSKYLTALLNSLETEIDNLVYKLYNLTDEEIKLVENGTK